MRRNGATHSTGTLAVTRTWPMDRSEHQRNGRKANHPQVPEHSPPAIEVPPSSGGPAPACQRLQIAAIPMHSGPAEICKAAIAQDADEVVLDRLAVIDQLTGSSRSGVSRSHLLETKSADGDPSHNQQNTGEMPPRRNLLHLPLDFAIEVRSRNAVQPCIHRNLK
jgi:hypothetical protein